PDALDTDVVRALHSPCLLDPAEGGLDLTPDDQADLVAVVTRGASVDVRLAAPRLLVLRHMWRDVAFTKRVDKGLGVVRFVGAESDATRTRKVGVDHLERSVALNGPGRNVRLDVDQQAVTVLHQGIDRVREFGTHPAALARHP